MDTYIVSFEKILSSGEVRCFTYSVESESFDHALLDVLAYRELSIHEIVAPNIDHISCKQYYPEILRHLTYDDYKPLED